MTHELSRAKKLKIYDAVVNCKKHSMKVFILALLGSLLFAAPVESHGNHDHGGSKQILPETNNTGPKVHLYREATCGCCTKWGTIMAKNGYQVIDKVMDDLSSLKRTEGIPGELASCHTAFVGGYFIEGHVPVASINKLLDEMPDIAGLAVPGMPMGSPGMEVPNSPGDAYAVLAVSTDGSTSIYDSYQGSTLKP